MRIHFVARALATAWPDLRDLSEDDVARHAARFRGGVNNWIVQTYLRLRGALAARGIAPTIGETLVGGCVNLAHRDSLNRLFVPYVRSFVVGVRADRAPVHLCDLEVVQNAVGASSPRTQFLNFWPQPGLLPRDPARGSRIERMAYFGRAGNAPAWFFDPAFHAALAALGVAFEVRDDRWHDYRDVDVVLAHRSAPPTMLRQKPASKLTNAWLAGTPALLGDEPAYASLRRGALDFLAIASPADVLDALHQLRITPGLYAAMAANGRRRGVDHTADAVKAEWLRFVESRVVPAAAAWRDAHAAGCRARFAQLARTFRQKRDAKVFKLRLHVESRPAARGAAAAQPGDAR